MIGTDQIPDYYAELGIASSATHDAIRSAYLALAKRFHPDVNGEPAAVERMRRVNDAYAVVGDERPRRQYDLQRLRSAGYAPRADQARTYRRGEPAADAAPTGRADASSPAPAAPPAQGSPATPPVRRRRRRRWVLLGALGASAVVAALLVGLRLSGIGAGAGSATGAQSGNATGAHNSVDEFVLQALKLFHEASHVTDAGVLDTAADHAWTLQAGNCLVFAGQYDAQGASDAARQRWQQQRVAFEAASNLVVAVKNCNGSDQAVALERVRTALSAVR